MDVSQTSGEAKRLVDAFAASTRFAGSAAENRFRDECEKRLRELGFVTRRMEFTYSELPAKLGPLICGALFAAGMYASGYLASSRRAPALGIVAAIAGVILAWITGAFLLKHIIELRPMRARSINLVATRGNIEPRVWLVAHTDSKSQTIRMLFRVVSVGTAWVFFIIAMGSMLAQLSGFSAAMGYPADLMALGSGTAAALSSIAILPAALCFIGNESPGALDNASGVAAILLAAGQIQADKNVGVLFTSAEELALAGARAFVKDHRGTGIVINCDTIDDTGRFICMTDNKKSRAAGELVRAGRSIDQTVRIRGMIKGILTDSIPFTEAGWDALTLSRGNLRTLSTVHTSGDRPERLDGTGIALAARIIASTVEELA